MMRSQTINIKDYILEPEEQKKNKIGFSFDVERVEINPMCMVIVNIIRVDHSITWYWIDPKSKIKYAGVLDCNDLKNISYHDHENIKKLVEQGYELTKTHAADVIAAILDGNEPEKV